SESKMKSERVGRAWAEKKKNAGNGAPITRRVPAWLTVEGDKFIVDKAKAAVVRRIYRMAASGYGLGAITKRLNAAKVEPIARADYWARSYVNKLLSSKATLGEYQPHTRRNGKRRAPEGDPVRDYFPAIITEDEWHAARAALQQRRHKGGRPAAKRINLFSGL